MRGKVAKIIVAWLALSVAVTVLALPPYKDAIQVPCPKIYGVPDTPSGCWDGRETQFKRTMFELRSYNNDSRSDITKPTIDYFTMNVELAAIIGLTIVTVFTLHSTARR